MGRCVDLLAENMQSCFSDSASQETQGTRTSDHPRNRTEAMTYEITLPIPANELSPNSRVCWQVKSREVKLYRSHAKLRGMIAIGASIPRHTEATCRVAWHAKTKRFKDPDNAAATLKSAWDGIVDSGLLSDDRQLTHLPIIFKVDKINPRVVLTITTK